MLISRTELHARLTDALSHYRVNLHYAASAGGGPRSYAVWADGQQFGEPTSHASAHSLREQLTATLVLDVLEDAGIPVPAAGEVVPA